MLVSVVLGMEPRAWCTLGKPSTHPATPWPCNYLRFQSVCSRKPFTHSDRYYYPCRFSHPHKGPLSQEIHRSTVVCLSLMKPEPVTTVTALFFFWTSIKIQWLSTDPFWYPTVNRANTKIVARDGPLTFLTYQVKSNTQPGVGMGGREGGSSPSEEVPATRAEVTVNTGKDTSISSEKCCL